MSSTIELESYLLKEQAIVQFVNDGNDTQPPTPVQAVQQQLLGAIQQLVEHVERLETRQPPSHNCEQRMILPRQRQGQPIICYCCGKEGHYAPRCVATEDHSGSSAGATTNQSEQYTHPQPFSFPVICCHVACMMFQCHFSLTLGQGFPF